MKIVVSKRNTAHLTKGKEYQVVIGSFPSEGKFFRIKSDLGSIIESHEDNFLTVEELREFRISKILK
jgi:hypothetical protein